MVMRAPRPDDRIPCVVPTCRHTRRRGDLPAHHNEILCREHWALVDHDRRKDHRDAGTSDPVRWRACTQQACERAATGTRPEPRVPNKKRSRAGDPPPDTWSTGTK